MRTELFEAKIPVDQYLEEYVNVEEFLECCRKCDGYGRKWSCPEFDFDPIDYWKQFDILRIYGKKIYLEEGESDNWKEALKQVKNEMADVLYEEEKKFPGSKSLSAGSCSICGDDNCTKLEGKPCKYPDKLRYSIEALGGNVAMTIEKLLGIKILWLEEGKMPEYFVLVAGLLYNE